MAKLYVGNLPYTATEDEIVALFGECGNVKSVNLITDRQTGRAKGFGFVEMDSQDGADKAEKELDGKDFGGRPLKVNKANEQQRTGGGGARGGRY